MAVIWIPSLLQPLTGGEQKIDVSGETLRQVIEHLEERFPGLKDRLCDGDRLKPSIVAVVDGQATRQGLRQRVSESSEVHFVPAISGGSGERASRFDGLAFLRTKG